MSRKTKRAKSTLRRQQQPAVAGKTQGPAGTPDAELVRPSTSTRRIFAYCILLAVVTFAVYSRAIRNPFINFDDSAYVTENRIVQQGLTEDAVRWAFTTTAEANWHPITWLSHELDCQVFGLQPAGHHLTSVIFHAANVVLLFLLLVWITENVGRSLLVAGLSAVHPINVESVAWVAERKSVLCMFFFLLTLGAYGWYARKPGIGRYFLVAILFAVGLAAKPMIVTLPFALLLLDVWPLQRVAEWPSRSPAVRPMPQASFWRLTLEKLPLLALAAASSVITMAVQKGAMERGVPLGVRFSNALNSYVLYLGKALWPVHLAAFYPYRGYHFPIWQWAVDLLLLAGITAWAFRHRSHRYLLVGWLWFLGTLVPTVGLVQVGDQGMADRYAYLPFLGLFVIIVWGAADLAKENGVGSKECAVAAVLVMAVLSFLTWRQIGFWRSNLDLWSHAVEVTSDNYVAENYLGEAQMVAHLQATGQRFSQEAALHFQNAVRLNPGDPTSRLNLGAALHESGQLDAAVTQYLTVLKMTTDPYLTSKALTDLGAAYHQKGEYEKSREIYLQALKQDPSNQTIFLNLGKLAMDQRIQRLSTSAAAHPSPEAYLQLAQAQQAADHIPEARSSYQLALKLNPNLSNAKEALNSLSAQTGR